MAKPTTLRAAVPGRADPPIPALDQARWQQTTEIMARVMDVAATMILRFDAAGITVLASGGSDNPFEVGATSPRGCGFYCDEVVANDAMLAIRDATVDARWAQSPDIELGLVSYLGLPLHWPDGRIFGTICALHRRPAEHSAAFVELIQHFAKLVENDLRALCAERDRLRAENELEKSSTQHQQTIDRLPAMVAAFDQEGRCLTANRQYCLVTGRGVDEVRGQHISALAGERGWEHVRPHMEAVLRGEESHYERLVPTARGPRTVSVTLVPDRDGTGAITGFTSLGVDVHERRAAERALRDSDARFRMVFESVSGGSWDWNIAASSSFVGGSLQALGFENAPHGHPLDFWWDRIHPDDRDRVRGELARYQTGATNHFATEYRVQASDGAYRWYQDTGRIVARSANGEATRIVGIHLDISDRKTSEFEARRHEAFLRTILDSIVDGVIATDTESRIVSANPIAVQMLGVPEAELVGQPIGAVTACTGERTLEAMTDAAIRPAPGASPHQREVRTLEVDGSRRYLSTGIAPIRSTTGAIRGAVVVCRDVTDELVMQERLQQAEKMQAIGQLAGGIAHDFNNMLAAIRTGAETVQVRAMSALDGASRDSLEMILKASDRAAELTSKLLAFSRKHEAEQPTAVDLHSVVRDAVTILERTSEQRIEFEVELDAHAPRVMGSYAALENAVLNLVINARHAMPDGGSITIRTADRDLSAAECAASPFALQPGPHVSLTVHDTGVGIPPELRHKIFEPFFTTKPSDEGTGLGLFAVYGTAVSHRGSIAVHGGTGRGTTFEILLPITQHAPECVIPTPCRAPSRKRILLVDDEALVRETARRALEHLGHDVKVASSGSEALAFYERAPADVVLLDMHMPDMDGAQTLDAIRAIDPDACVVICSGCADPEQMKAVLAAGIAGRLDKPFKIAQIQDVIAAAAGA